MKQKSIAKNYIYNLLNLASTALIPLITYPYVTRVLSPSGLGKVNFAVSVSTYFVLIASLGIPTYGIREIARNRENKQETEKIVNEIFLINLFMSFISILALIVTTLIVPQFRDISLLLFINAINVIFAPISFNWFYQGVEEYGYITIRNVTFRILSAVLIFMFVKSFDDYYIYAIILVIQTSGAYIFNFIHLRNYVHINLFKKYSIKKHIKPIFTFFAMSAAISVYAVMPNTFLGIFLGDEAVGYFSVAQKINSLLLTLVCALGTVALPRLSYYIKKGDKKHFSFLIKKSVNFSMAIACAVIGYLMIAAKSLILLFAGEQYNNSVLILQIMCYILIFSGLSNVTGIQILIPLKNENVTTNSVILGAIIGVISFLVLIPRFGLIGVALSCVIVEIFVLAFQMIYIKKNLKVSIISKDLFKYIVSAVVSTVIIYFVNVFIHVTPFVNLLILFVIYSSIYILSLFILKDEIVYYFKDMVIKFLRKVNKRDG